MRSSYVFFVSLLFLHTSQLLNCLGRNMTQTFCLCLSRIPTEESASKIKFIMKLLNSIEEVYCNIVTCSPLKTHQGSIVKIYDVHKDITHYSHYVLMSFLNVIIILQLWNCKSSLGYPAFHLCKTCLVCFSIKQLFVMILEISKRRKK